MIIILIVLLDILLVHLVFWLAYLVFCLVYMVYCVLYSLNNLLKQCLQCSLWKKVRRLEKVLHRRRRLISGMGTKAEDDRNAAKRKKN